MPCLPRRARALRAWAPCLAFGTLLISGCADGQDNTPLSMDSAETPGAHYAVAPGTAPPEPEFVSSPPFDFDVEVHGSFKPAILSTCRSQRSRTSPPQTASCG